MFRKRNATETVRDLELPEDPAERMAEGVINGPIRFGRVKGMIKTPGEYTVSVNLDDGEVIYVSDCMFVDGDPVPGDYVVAFPSGRLLLLDSQEGQAFLRQLPKEVDPRQESLFSGERPRHRVRVKLLRDYQSPFVTLEIPDFSTVPSVISYHGETYIRTADPFAGYGTPHFVRVDVYFACEADAAEGPEAA